MSKFINLTGKVFSRLTVIRRASNGNGRGTRWVCRCECGNRKIVSGKCLRYGETKSCGCLSRDNTIKRNTTHGLSDHHLNAVWGYMKTRCYNPNAINYKDYGGRGIKICKSWLECFENFYNDVIDLYIPGFSIDRIDVNGDYEPGNVRWVDKTIQANNKRFVGSLIGETFEHLRVIKFHSYGSYNRIFWVCVCDCGEKVVVSGTRLRLGERTSCSTCSMLKRSGFSKSQIFGIRKMYDANYSIDYIAKYYKTSKSTVRRIGKREVYKNI